jgi:hypothetical protein
VTLTFTEDNESMLAKWTRTAQGAAGLDWRGDRLTIRLDGTNLGDERKPVSESEFADEAGLASYYLLEARRIWLSFDWLF